MSHLALSGRPIAHPAQRALTRQPRAIALGTRPPQHSPALKGQHSYVQNQAEHHRKEVYQITYDERYVWHCIGPVCKRACPEQSSPFRARTVVAVRVPRAIAGRLPWADELERLWRDRIADFHKK